MGRGLQARRGDTEGRITLRLAASYLAVFLIVIVSLSVVAYLLISGDIRDLLEPALATPQGQQVLQSELRRVMLALVALDLGLALIVAVASYLLARAAVRPLELARRREERFAADVAHELRTPLGVIAGVAQAAQGGDPASHDAAFATIATHALEAGDCISDLLTLARHGDARALVREPVDLYAIAARTVQQMQPPAAQRGITVELQGPSVIVDGEEGRLRQLLRNLLDNALEYAVSKVTITIGSYAQTAEVSVEDDGPGVEPALTTTLFERFARGSRSRGSGLGLAICRWVVQAHGGSIVLEGRSRFVARLPLGNYPGTERVVAE
ncbi:MAG TPA: HAMP domain-containing sensor histidine kinase [Candidatus Acidoferrales bacterium]|nr:HAMP domain-containing sensor histidine kinase [Candidatus Acidoferrales bacterium]